MSSKQAGHNKDTTENDRGATAYTARQNDQQDAELIYDNSTEFGQLHFPEEPHNGIKTPTYTSCQAIGQNVRPTSVQSHSNFRGQYPGQNVQMIGMQTLKQCTPASGMRHNMQTLKQNNLIPTSVMENTGNIQNQQTLKFQMPGHLPTAGVPYEMVMPFQQLNVERNRNQQQFAQQSCQTKIAQPEMTHPFSTTNAIPERQPNSPESEKLIEKNTTHSNRLSSRDNTNFVGTTSAVPKSDNSVVSSEKVRRSPAVADGVKERTNVNLYPNLDQITSDFPEMSKSDTIFTTGTTSANISKEQTETVKPKVPPRRINSEKSKQSVPHSDPVSCSNSTADNKSYTGAAVGAVGAEQQYQHQHVFKDRPLLPVSDIHNQTGPFYRPLPPHLAYQEAQIPQLSSEFFLQCNPSNKPLDQNSTDLYSNAVHDNIGWSGQQLASANQWHNKMNCTNKPGYGQEHRSPPERYGYSGSNDPWFYQGNYKPDYSAEGRQPQYTGLGYHGQIFPTMEYAYPSNDPRIGQQIYPNHCYFPQGYDPNAMHFSDNFREEFSQKHTSKEDDGHCEKIKSSDKEVTSKENTFSDSEDDDDDGTSSSTEEDEHEGCFIKVEGVRNIKSKENLEYYFENKKKAGGGPIKEIEYDKYDDNIMYIQFEIKQDAQNVIGRKHKIEGFELFVSQYTPPRKAPYCNVKVLIANLKATTTKECLFNFLEAKTQCQPVDMLRHESDDSIAVVTMESDIDFDALEKSCNKYKLEQATLKISRIRYSNCVVVSNLPNECSHDTLLYYFENHNKSGGGPVDRIVFNEDMSVGFVYFTDYKTVDTVTCRVHVINKQTVNIKEYQECLGEPKTWKKKERLELPYTVTLSNTRLILREFLKYSSKHRQEVDRKLENVFAKIDYEKTEITLISTFENASNESILDMKTWQKQAQNGFEESITNLSHFQCQVPEICFSEVTKKLHNMSIKNPEDVIVKLSNRDRTISITGVKDLAESLYKELIDFIINLEQVKIESLSLTKIECSLLGKSEISSALNKLYPTLKINIDIQNNRVTLEGKPDDITEAKLKIHEQRNNYVKENVPVSEGCVQLLNKEIVIVYVNKKLSGKRIACELVIFEDHFTVYCLNEDSMRESIEVIQRSVCEETIPVCNEALLYLETDEWKAQIKAIQQKHDDKLFIDVLADDGFVIVCATNDVIRSCVTGVKDLLKANTRLQKKLSCAKTVCMYVDKYLHYTLKDISTRLEMHRVQVLLCSKHDGFLISGTEEGITQAKSQMEDIVKSVKSREHTIEEPFFVQSLRSTHGRSHIHTIEKDLSCLIVEKGVYEEAYAEIGIEAKLTCQVNENTSVFVVQGDITKLSTQVIVNSADEKLSLSYGLGKILLKEGGSQVLKECADYIKKHDGLEEDEICITRAGDLQAENIIHIYVAGYQGGRYAENKIKTAVINCLDWATGMGAKSIAFPAIGCGGAKYPEELATEIIVSTIKTFCHSNDDTPLAKIYLCDKKRTVVEEFTRAVKKYLLMKKFHDETREADRDRRKSDPPRKPVSGKSDISRPVQAKLGNISVSVTKGSVAKSKADVIVNVTDRSLNLSYGTISASLLKEGGDKIQEELTANCPNGLQHGQIVVTSGHKLMCSSVIHVCMGAWNQKNDQESIAYLKAIIVNCLSTTQRMKQQSMVFPAIGTGKLRYPKDVVAREIFAAIEVFANKYTTTCIKEVRIVIYVRDTDTIKVFEDELRHRNTGKHLSQRGLRQFSNFGEGDYGNACENAVQVGGLSVYIKEGDILEEDADCIVTSIPLSMDLRKGATSRSLLKKCGQAIVDELEKKKDTLRSYNLVTSSAPNLQCKRIFYLAVQSEAGGWKTVMIKALKEAEKRQMESIAFPALGTGGRSKPKEMAKVMLQSIVDFERTSPKFLKEIRIVIFQNEMVGDFKQVASRFESNRRGSDSSASDDDDKPGHDVTYIVVAREEKTVNKAISRIEKGFDKKEFRDDTLRHFNRYHDKQLKELQSKMDVQIVLDKHKGTLKMRGFVENVQAATDEIHRIMREVLLHEKHISNAELMSNIVQWYFKDTNGTEVKLIPYEKTVNLKIENALEAKKPSVTFKDNENVAYTINFAKMVEYPDNKPNETIEVIRKDLKADTQDIPSHWTDFKGNLTVVALKATDKEYQDTARSFVAAAGAGVTVVKIERIQNRTLWQQYQALKRLMEQKNPPHIKNESILWHGSSNAGIENIKVHGFDRSYSNSANYGVGVYFSPHASVSRGYARPDPTGVRRLFRCRVLTGEFCLAQAGIRTGPPKPSGGPNAKYDSVVDNMNNTQEIVIFNDTQAYPDYLISFR